MKNKMIEEIEKIFPFLKNPHDLSFVDFSNFWKLFYGNFQNFTKFWIDEFDFKKDDGTQDNSIANILVKLNIFTSKSEVYKSVKNNGLRINNKVVNPNSDLQLIEPFKVENSDLKFWVIKRGKTDFEIIWF